MTWSQTFFRRHRVLFPLLLLAYLLIVHRVDSHTIGFTGKDMVEVSKFFGFMTRYSADITP